MNLLEKINTKLCACTLVTMTLALSGYMAAETYQDTKLLPIVADILKNEFEMRFDKTPRNFRTTQDEINDQNSPNLNLEGLKDLRIAGTGQFNEYQLIEILNALGKKTLVVDLREETHLIIQIADGDQLQVSAFLSQNTGNVGKSVEEIKLILQMYKEYLKNQGQVVVDYTDDSEVEYDEHAPLFSVENVFTEEDIVGKIKPTYTPGVEYLLLPMGDHRTPTAETVDEILKLLTHLRNDPELTILFHCRAGRGRTGLLMVMTDIVENAKKYQLSLEQILKRQELLSSPDFTKVKAHRDEASAERFVFLKDFYQYVISEDGLDSGIPYSTWLEI